MYTVDMSKDVNRAACLASQKRSASSITRFDVSAYGAWPVRMLDNDAVAGARVAASLSSHVCGRAASAVASGSSIWVPYRLHLCFNYRQQYITGKAI